ncbi:MAG: thioredoxin family protein [Anaerolineales bacterium]
MWKEKLIAVLKEDGLTIFIVLALVAAYAILRTPGDSFATSEALARRLQEGQPTVVEFYANSCSICLISKPKVDRMERDLEGRAGVLRLNVRDNGAGQALAARWGVRGVPTFFVVDGAGEVVYAQAGAPDVAAIQAAVADLTDSP